jgi:hypothetical protein
MEISAVKRRVLDTIERARRSAADRRAHADRATSEFETFLNSVAAPILRQVANVLRAQRYQFSVSTPAGSVRLTSDRSAEDYIELFLDTAGSRPVVIGHVSRARGRRVTESQRPIADRPVAELTEEDVLEFVLKELEPFVEK